MWEAYFSLLLLCSFIENLSCWSLKFLTERTGWRAHEPDTCVPPQLTFYSTLCFAWQATIVSNIVEMTSRRFSLFLRCWIVFHQEDVESVCPSNSTFRCQECSNLHVAARSMPINSTKCFAFCLRCNTLWFLCNYRFTVSLCKYGSNLFEPDVSAETTLGHKRWNVKNLVIADENFIGFVKVLLA